MFHLLFIMLTGWIGLWLFAKMSTERFEEEFPSTLLALVLVICMGDLKLAAVVLFVRSLAVCYRIRFVVESSLVWSW